MALPEGIYVVLIKVNDSDIGSNFLKCSFMLIFNTVKFKVLFSFHFDFQYIY